jgi:hypothetical protein
MRPIQATVLSTDNGILVRVRRGYRAESLYGRTIPEGLKYGDRVLVRRERNNPFLVYVGRPE